MTRTVPAAIAAAACILAIGGCGKAGDKVEPSASASAGEIAPIPPAEADRAADETAIKALVAQIYAHAEDTENPDKAVWPYLTPRFAEAWKTCYDLENQVEDKAHDESAAYGDCLEDAGNFIPGQDLDPGVGTRLRVSDIAWKSDDAAIATIKMRIFRDDKTETPVTLSLAREGGKWLVDDLDKEGGPTGIGQRPALEAAIPQLKKGLAGK